MLTSLLVKKAGASGGWPYFYMISLFSSPRLPLFFRKLRPMLRRYPRECGPLVHRLRLQAGTGETAKQVSRLVQKAGSGLSVVEDRKVQLAQACGIGNGSDRGNLAFPD